MFAALAADEWSDRPAPGRADGERDGWRGGLILVLASLASVALLWVAATVLGWRRDRALWVGFGAFLAVLTLARPWWFWDNYRARWLRRLIGDEPTAGVYLMVAAALIWVGLFTEWTFGRR